MLLTHLLPILFGLQSFLNPLSKNPLSDSLPDLVRLLQNQLKHGLTRDPLSIHRFKDWQRCAILPRKVFLYATSVETKATLPLPAVMPSSVSIAGKLAINLLTARLLNLHLHLLPFLPLFLHQLHHLQFLPRFQCCLLSPRKLISCLLSDTLRHLPLHNSDILYLKVWF